MFSNPTDNLLQFGITEGMTVADIGAGSGHYALKAAELTTGKVYAIDLMQNLLDKIKSEAAHRRLSNIEVVWANAEEIGGTRLRDASIDRAISSNILFQLEKIDTYLLEIKRILKKGGKLLIIDWSEASSLNLSEFVPKDTILAHLKNAGFVLEQSFNAGDHHYGIIAQRI